MKKCYLAIMAVLAMWLGSTQPVAAEAKPVVMVSIAGFDAVMADVDYMGSLVGNGQVNAAQIEGAFKIFTAGKGGDLFDRKAPWGMVMLNEGSEFYPQVFLPIKDKEGFYMVIKNFSKGEPTDEGDGVKSIKMQNAPTPICMKEVGDYIYFAQSPEHLKDCAKDPAAKLGKLATEYDIGVQAMMQNVPADMRQEWAGFIRQGMENALKQSPGEDEAAFQIRKKIVESQIAQLEAMLQDLDTMTFGLTIDSSIKAVQFDVAATIKPGSSIATNLSTTSSFAGFVQPDSGLTGNFTTKVDPKSIEQVVSMINSAMEGARRELEKDSNLGADGQALAKDILSDLSQIAIKTIEAGKLDAAGSVAMGDKSLNAFAGATVADGKSVENLVKKVVEAARSELRDVKLDMGEHGGVKLHQVSVPLPPEEKVQNVLGDTLTLTVGIADKAVYVAAGKDGLNQLKTAIDASTKAGQTKLDMLSLNAAATPMVTLAKSMDDGNPGLEAVAGSLKDAAGKDRILVTSTEIANGSRMRIQIDEGIIRIMGLAARLAPGRRGGGGFGPPGGF